MNDWAGTELLTAAQMRAVEQAAIESGAVTGLELMERAGRGVVEAIFEEWPELKAGDHRAVVLCGPGNNGGDGFVVARLLQEWGWQVEVFLYGDPTKLPPDAKTNCERWLAMGEVGVLAFPTVTEPDADRVHAALGNSGTSILVDALFGTGLTRPITGLKPLLYSNNLHDALPDLYLIKTVAVDIPSGICSDSGRPVAAADDQDLPYRAVHAQLTVPFHRAKLGHVLADGPIYCGTIRVKEIGLRQPAGDTIVHAPRPVVGQLGKSAVGHKYSHGHALILSGGPGRGGAARLAARGALRTGAGLVTLACPPAALIENAAHLDAIMLKPLADADVLTRILEDERIKALCLGPGMGIERAAGMLPVALGSGRRQVLDADALTALASDAGLFALLHDSCVLTPHAGEFARLFPDIARKLDAPATKGPAYSKVDATREAAARAGCTVLFKGADTVIATPDGRCAINAAQYEKAAPWLATAGAGDVLSGFIAGLLARGFDPFEAACTAAWLHVECALSFGPGLIAEDLPEELPRVFRSFGV